MAKINVSVAVKSGICAVLFTKSGRVVFRSVFRTEVTDAKKYSNLIFCLKKAILALRTYSEETEPVEEVVFECASSNLIQWVEQGNTKGDCENEFEEMFAVLDSIPLEYSFVYNKSPKALVYAKADHLPKMKLSGLNLEDYDD